MMSDTKSSSKKEIMVCDSGSDRLSELPSCIIDIILSSLTTRDAVRTSILSRQFRYKWISLPHLVFDASEFSSMGAMGWMEEIRSMECMEKFVTNVLKLHKGPIHKFSLLYGGKEPFISFMPQRLVDLVRSIVYSLNKLTHLELYECVVDTPPVTFTGFLFLRCLILVNVIIGLEDIESVVASSPLLETLKSVGSSRYNGCPVFRISAPNLKYLEFKTFPVDYMQIYICAPLLAEASISIRFSDNYDVLHQRAYCSDYNYTNFFGGCTRLQKLKGNYFSKVMSYCLDSCKYSFVLPHLVVIELDDVNFEDVKEKSIVARLVAGAPNLKKLVLGCKFGVEYLSASDVSDTEFICPPNFKCQHLRTITVEYRTGFPSQIEFLKLLLENSPALEQMNLIPYGDAFQADVDMRAEVLKCNIASLNLKLWLG